MEWSNGLVIEFLELYGAEPDIWDHRSARHKDRSLVAEAWERIAQSLGGNFSVMDLKKKKESLMTSYRTQHAKHRQSIMSGPRGDNIYRPSWFAYSLMNSFLGPLYENKAVYPVSKKEADDEDSEDEERDTDPLDHEHDEYVLEYQEAEADTTPPPAAAAPPSAGRSGKRRRKSAAAAADASSAPDDDEYELFARLLVRRLRKLPAHRAERVMNKIDNLVHEESMAAHYGRGLRAQPDARPEPARARTPSPAAADHAGGVAAETHGD